LGSSSSFCPLEALQPVWLMPEVYCTIPRISNRSYSGRQEPLASTTRGSLLAAKGGTMGGNSNQMMPGICTQGSLTCRKSATWDRSFYFPSEGRRAEDFYRPLKIRRLRPRLNPRTWVSEASTLPLHHRCRLVANVNSNLNYI
jgi:hypothetical protein